MTNSSPDVPRYDPYQFDAMMLARLVVVGALTGIVGWGLYLLIARYFVDPVFCQSADTFAVCKNGGTIAWTAAHVIAAAAAVAALAKLAVYRPLLVLIGVLVALWGAHAWLGGMAWYVAMLWQAGLFAAAFAVFGWMARITNFAVSAAVVVLLAVAFRAVLMFA
jgi:hypothetical protein